MKVSHSNDAGLAASVPTEDLLKGVLGQELVTEKGLLVTGEIGGNCGNCTSVENLPAGECGEQAGAELGQAQLTLS